MTTYAAVAAQDFGAYLDEVDPFIRICTPDAGLDTPWEDATIVWFEPDEPETFEPEIYDEALAAAGWHRTALWGGPHECRVAWCATDEERAANDAATWPEPNILTSDGKSAARKRAAEIDAESEERCAELERRINAHPASGAMAVQGG